ncbi:MAG: hypothetical protein PQ975_12355 [Methanobacterium sp.]|jgi:hypothetical protein
MPEIYTGRETVIKGDRIVCEARKISQTKVIVRSGRHKAQKVVLRDNAVCIIVKELKFLSA